MNRKMRIVVEVVQDYVYTSLLNGAKWTSYHLVEVYSSVHKVDCQKWIERALIDNPNESYRIYVEDI